MTAVAWAFASAVLYGLSDFLAGVQSRRRSFLWVGFVAQCVSATCALVPALLSGHAPSGAALGWGAAAAVGQAAGTLMLLRGLARGAMHVAGPVSAVFGAGVPVAVGALTGERPGPLAVAGIVLALPAVWLVASGDAGSTGEQPGESGEARASLRGGVLDGIAAGAGFGLFFTALARAGRDAGPWPVAVCQGLAVVLMGAAVLALRPSGSVRAAAPAWTVGATGFAASLAYLLASHGGMLTIVSVVTSLYPAVTVALAAVVLRERARRVQGVGLVLAAVAVAAIAVSG